MWFKEKQFVRKVDCLESVIYGLWFGMSRYISIFVHIYIFLMQLDCMCQRCLLMTPFFFKGQLGIGFCHVTIFPTEPNWPNDRINLSRPTTKRLIEPFLVISILYNITFFLPWIHYFSTYVPLLILSFYQPWKSLISKKFSIELILN